MKLVVVTAALAELHDTVAFYTERAGKQLGLAFAAEFERVTSLILVKPEIGKAFRGNKRRFVMRRFPYNVIYQAASDEVRIIAIAHHSRRPAHWANRK